MVPDHDCQRSGRKNAHCASQEGHGSGKEQILLAISSYIVLYLNDMPGFKRYQESDKLNSG